VEPGEKIAAQRLKAAAASKLSVSARYLSISLAYREFRNADLGLPSISIDPQELPDEDSRRLRDDL
jgi:hypothetical protein